MLSHFRIETHHRVVVNGRDLLASIDWQGRVIHAREDLTDGEWERVGIETGKLWPRELFGDDEADDGWNVTGA